MVIEAPLKNFNIYRPDQLPTALVRWILICLVAIQMAMIEYAWILASKHMQIKVSGGKGQQTSAEGLHPLDKLMLILSPSCFFIVTPMFWSYLS